MSHKYRLLPFIDEVKKAGLDGQSMNDALAKVVDREDLTPHEIRRIAEDANRGVHISLTKQAHAAKKDARLKFELADPEKHIDQARKSAAASLVRSGSSEASKFAAVNEAGGDPFAAPHIERPLSILAAPLDEALACETKIADLRRELLELERIRAQAESVQHEAKLGEVSAMIKAEDSNKRMVQSAIDMITSGVRLPDLYRAIYASVSGSRAPESARDEARSFLRLLVAGLRERGVPNHKLGFRFNAFKNEVDGLSTEDIVTMCENAVAYDHGAPSPLPLTKRAAVYITKVHGDDNKLTGKHPYEDAGDWLDNRPAFQDHKMPASYVDERNTGNMPNGAPRIFNGDSEFIVAVTDLQGAKERLRQMVNSDEYMGLKLKEIAEAAEPIKKAYAEELEKLANIPGNVPVASPKVPMTTSDKVNMGVGALGFAGPIAAQMMAGSQQKREHKHQKDMMAQQSSMSPTQGF